MTTKTTFFSVMLCITFIFTSCSIEGDSSVNPEPPGTYGKVTPNDEVLKSFEIKYPSAKSVEWSTNSNYYVADFTDGASTVNAWFGQQGDWTLSKSSITSKEEKTAVTESFSQSTYAGWDVKGRNILSRKDMSSMYVIEVINGNKDVNIYYSENGDLIKAIDARNYTDSPVSIPSVVSSLISGLFNNPEIIDIWNDSLGPKVGVMENNVYKVVALDSSYGWICTIWSIEEQTVPDVVLNGFKGSSYGDADVSDIKILENSEDLSYLFYFDNAGKHKIATVMESGNLKSVMSY